MDRVAPESPECVRPFSSPPRIGIFVVTFNASSTIGSVLQRIKPETWERITEVFIFDDHSADDTAGRAWAERPHGYARKIKIFHNQVNLGYGGNQKRGYQYALQRGFDIVVLLHGDGQYAPEVLDDLIDPLARGDADAVFGSRMMLPGGARKGGMPFYKYLGNRILTGFQNALLGRSLTEYHSGYRAYNVRTLATLPLRGNSNDFHFDNEIIVQLHEAGSRIREVSIPTYYGSEICYVNGIKYAWNVFKTNLRYRLHKAGLLYAAQFDLAGGNKYRFKPTRFSSHGRILELAGRAPIEGGSAVLDVGCGAGFLARRLRDMGHAVVGVDVYESEEARANCTRFVVSDVESGFGIPDADKFDLVVLADVLEHTRQPERVLLRTRRSLKPGGRVIASTGNVANIYIRLMLLLGSFEYTERGILDNTHCRLFTLGSFRKLFQDLGFRIIRRRACPIPFEVIFPGSPRLARFLAGLYMCGVWIWPSMFAYQTVMEAVPIEGPTELLRGEEINRSDYVEWEVDRPSRKDTPGENGSRPEDVPSSLTGPVGM